MFGHCGARAEAARIGVPFLGAVPLTMDLRRSADLRRPLLATDPDGAVGMTIAAIAGWLANEMKARALLTGKTTSRGVFR